MLSTALESLLMRFDVQTLSTQLLSKTSLTAADRLALDMVAQELSERLEECRVECRKLATLEVAVARQLAFASSIPGPIHRLSDDELRLIFMAVAADFRNPFHRAPYFAKVTCTVSRRWRSVARSTALLWNHIVLLPSRVVISRGLPQRTTPWDHFPLLASLCSRAPIHIRWNCDIHPAPLLGFASTISNAIRSFDLTADWSSLPIMASPAFDYLQNFALTVKGEKDQFLLHHINCLRSLTSFHLYCQNGDAFPSSFTTPVLPKLRDLRVRLIPGPPVSFIVGTLTGCSQITALDLRCDFPHGIPPKDSQQVFLPSLVTIYLADAACAIVWFLRAPSAVTLYMSEIRDIYVHGSVFAAIHAFASASTCALETLAFSYAYCSAELDDMRLCFSALDANHLIIEHSWDEPFPRPFGEAIARCLCDEQRALLPHLRTVFFRGSSHRRSVGIQGAIEDLRRSRASERRVGTCVVEVVDDFYSNVGGGV